MFPSLSNRRMPLPRSNLKYFHTQNTVFLFHKTFHCEKYLNFSISPEAADTEMRDTLRENKYFLDSFLSSVCFSRLLFMTHLAFRCILKCMKGLVPEEDLWLAQSKCENRKLKFSRAIYVVLPRRRATSF